MDCATALLVVCISCLLIGILFVIMKIREIAGHRNSECGFPSCSTPQSCIWFGGNDLYRKRHLFPAKITLLRLVNGNDFLCHYKKTLYNVIVALNISLYKMVFNFIFLVIFHSIFNNLFVTLQLLRSKTYNTIYCNSIIINFLLKNKNIELNNRGQVIFSSLYNCF